MAVEIGHIAQLLDATLDQHQHRKGMRALCMDKTPPSSQTSQLWLYKKNHKS